MKKTGQSLRLAVLRTMYYVLSETSAWFVADGLADKLAQTVREINPEICLPEHWTPLSPEIIIQDLREGNG